MKDLILGCHLLFAREGATIDDFVVSPTYKPDTDPEANYTVLPTVQDWEPKVSRSFVERRAPSPGIYQTRKRIPISQKITHAFSLQEFSLMTFAELVLGGNAPAAGVFVPGERTDLVRGWWIVQGYDQEDNKIITLNIWGEASVEGYKFGERLDPYAVMIEQLYSTLNTGLVETLT